MDNKKPIVVTIIGVINLFLGVFTLLMGGYGLFDYFTKGQIYMKHANAPNSESMWLFSVIALITGVIFVWTGYGLLYLKNIARNVTIYFTVASVLYNFVIHIHHLKVAITNPIDIYLVVISIYLSCASVKERFK